MMTSLQVQCAVQVLLPSIELPGVGFEHLWVCSSDQSRGQVTVVSLQSNQPHVVESFKVRNNFSELMTSF